MVPVSYLHDPSSNPCYASLFFLRIRPRDIYINIVILLIETAAAVEQLVKLCVFAEYQGSIPVSLKFQIEEH